MTVPNILGKEFECINKILKKTLNSGVGDDCAIMHQGKQKLLISTDSFIEDIHFSKKTSSLRKTGEKCAEASISDLAAMGARPLYMLMAVSSKNTKDITEISSGIALSLKRHNMVLVGGDTTRSNKLFINITVIGSSKKPIKRSGAKHGDGVYISSYTGLSSAGFYVLQKGIKAYPDLKKAHRSPRALIKEGLKISNLANAMIDISDSLSSELYHIAFSSNCSILIDAVPTHPSIVKLCKEKELDPSNFILFGGEDYQLLFTSNKHKQACKFGIRIGTVIKNKKRPKVLIKTKNGSKILRSKSAYLHF